MNILIDAIPESVDILGKTYNINTDFRASILFEIMVQDKRITPNEKKAIGISLYFDTKPIGLDNSEILAETMEQILWFYRCGKEIEFVEGKEEQPILDYEFDADYIYSAFLTQYGIDLQIENLHWWKFRALFKSLNDTNKIIKIMQYRGMKIDNKMSPENKKFYREMKHIYKIPDKRKQSEIEASFNDGMSSMM